MSQHGDTVGWKIHAMLRMHGLKDLKTSQTDIDRHLSTGAQKNKVRRVWVPVDLSLTWGNGTSPTRANLLNRAGRNVRVVRTNL